MRFQPGRDYVSNDDIATPPELARCLIEHFRPSGRVLEPCRGTGNIHRHLPPESPWCEIKEGHDFFAWREPVDWVFTNPPWSLIRPFLAHAFQVSEHVVFLMTINHVWTKARLRLMREAGFGLKEILMVPTPRDFPATGFQLGMIHFQRHWNGPLILSELREANALQPTACTCVTTLPSLLSK